MRCINVALLCVQENAPDRPPQQVSLLYESAKIWSCLIPEPKHPAYFHVRLIEEEPPHLVLVMWQCLLYMANMFLSFCMRVMGVFFNLLGYVSIFAIQCVKFLCLCNNLCLICVQTPTRHGSCGKRKDGLTFFCRWTNSFTASWIVDDEMYQRRVVMCTRECTW